MSPEEEKYYENYFDLFITNGWKQFVEEATESYNDYRIEDITDERALDKVQGERKILQRVISFETGVRNAYDMIQERSNAQEI